MIIFENEKFSLRVVVNTNNFNKAYLELEKYVDTLDNSLIKVKDFTTCNADEFIDVDDDKMTKSELKNGMIVTCRNGDKYMVLKDSCFTVGEYNVDETSDILIGLGTTGYLNLSSYNEDLKFDGHYNDTQWDIVKVEVGKYCAYYGAKIDNRYQTTIELYNNEN